MSDAKNDRDEKALDALIALSLKAISGKGNEKIFQSLISERNIALPQDYEDALKKIGATISDRIKNPLVVDPENSEMVADVLELTAMNRKSETDFSDQDAEEEIKKKRQEILDMLNKEKNEKKEDDGKEKR